jgi:hypothetical protein
MRRLTVLGICLAALLAFAPASARAATCTTTVASTSALTTAVNAAAAGSTVCLTDGTYGSISLAQVKSSPGVTISAVNPGAVTVGSVSVTGKWLAVTQLKMASVNIGNVDQVRIQNNEVSGGTWIGNGSTSVTPTNVSILNNVLRHDGGSGERDTIDAQRFVALDIEGNQMFTNPEDGNHQDGFQSIWGGRGLIFKKNWIRDGSAQGFFIKDGAVTNLTFEDNLIANRSGGTGDAPFQIYSVSPNAADPFYTGKTSIAHNTIYSNPNGSFVRDDNKALDVRYNVFDSWNLSGNTPTSEITQDYNVIQGGTLGRRGANDVAGPPQFADASTYDYELKASSPGNYSSGRAGITWRPADQQYGPSDDGTTTPPDTTPPDTSITAGPSDPTTSTSATFSFAATETGSTYECKLDSGSFTACSAPKSYTGLSAGQHTFSVRATDAAGNTDATPASWTWTINAQDTTAPDTTISASPSDPTTSTSASFSFTSSEAGSTFQCKLDSGAYAACTSPKSYSGLSTGQHTFSVRATDAAGNTDATPATDTWTINAPSDTTAPDTTISASPSDPTTSTSASFSFTSTEAGSTFECKLDGGVYAGCTSPKSYNGLGTGQHTFSVRATDAAGNTDATPATDTWTINPPSDTTAPNTTITSGPTGSTGDKTPSFAFSSTEAGSTFQCRVDSGAWVACTSPWTTPSQADGPHTVSVRATDAAGNTDATPAERSFTVDTVAPRTTITSAPPILALSGSGEVDFTVDESGATSQCRLDGGAWTACTSPYEFSGLGIGNHTFGVRSTDAAGNVENPGPSASWTVVLPLSTSGSTTPAATVSAPATPSAATTPSAPATTTSVPTVTLSAPAADSTVSSSVRVAATATSPTGIRRVEFWVDSKKLATDKSAPYRATVSLPKTLKSGTHTVTARAFDGSGQAASSAELIKVSSRGKGRARAVSAMSAARGALLASAVAGPDSTRLAGQAPRQRTVRVALTSCSDRKGAVVDSTRLRADAQGRVDATRGKAGLCVLRMTLVS